MGKDLIGIDSDKFKPNNFAFLGLNYLLIYPVRLQLNISKDINPVNKTINFLRI